MRKKTEGAALLVISLDRENADMKLSAFLSVVQLLVVLDGGFSQGCAPPTAADLENVMRITIGDGSSSEVLQLAFIEFNIVCRAYGMEINFLRGVSVVVQYTCSGSRMCPTGTALEQIDTECVGGQWAASVLGSTDFIRSTTTKASLNTTTREDCSFCFSPELAGNLSLTSDTITHCVGCSSSCDKGLKRCYGEGENECCSFYNSSVCVQQCPTPFTPDIESVCACPQGTYGHNCQGADCGTLPNPQNGRVRMLKSDSIAFYSCNTGYCLNGYGYRTCLRSGIWSGTTPRCDALMSTTSPCKETTYKIVAILFGAVSGLLGITLGISLVAVFKIHREIIIMKSKHLHMNTVPNEAYGVVKGANPDTSDGDSDYATVYSTYHEHGNSMTNRGSESQPNGVVASPPFPRQVEVTSD